MKYIKSKLTGNHFYEMQPVSSSFQYISDNKYQNILEKILLKKEDSIEVFKDTSLLDILEYLKYNKKIEDYWMVHTEPSLKTAILLNGPCLGILGVHSNNKNFWDGENVLGVKIVLITGWNSEGFIVDGVILPYTRFNLFKEIWTRRLP